MTAIPRYAVYFAPARESAFWRFGCAWLGRDPEGRAAEPRPPLPEAVARDWPAADLAALTASPASYGFHATLKPPFRLAESQTRAAFEAAAETFARAQTPFDCPMVAPGALGRFIAFRLIEPAPQMNALAGAAVTALEDFRGPQTEQEHAKRRAAGLTPRQEEMLARWGYPYVFDEFRFHMTLTSAVADDGRRSRLADALKAMAAETGAVGAMRVDGIALYEQPRAGAPFALFRRLPFGV